MSVHTCAHRQTRVYVRACVYMCLSICMRVHTCVCVRTVFILAPGCGQAVPATHGFTTAGHTCSVRVPKVV